MPYQTETVRLSIQGVVTGAGGWSTGLSVPVVLSGGSWGLNQIQGVSDALQGLAATWWTSIKALNLGQLSYTGVKVYVFHPGTSKAYAAAVSPVAPVAGTGAAQGGGLFTSLCVSLLSDTVGRSARGRIYIPFTVACSGGQFTSGNLTTANTATKALIDSINAADWTSFNVTSKRVSVASLTKGLNYTITRLRCDSVPDTQHRRTDKLIATNTATATVAP